MADIDARLIKCLGWNTQGDLGPYTMYTATDKGLVFYAKAPPKEPPSYLQGRERNRFRHVAKQWAALPNDVRQRWEQATIDANLVITGYGLWTYFLMTNDRASIETIQRITGLTLL